MSCVLVSYLLVIMFVDGGVCLLDYVFVGMCACLVVGACDFVLLFVRLWVSFVRLSIRSRIVSV
mgnify:CR=1 FL=1